MSCKNTLYSQHFGPTRAEKAPKPCEELNFFRGEHRGGHPRIIAQAWPVAEWWILWLDPLQTGSLAASGSPQSPPRVDKPPIFCCAERLWQRLAPSKSTLENGPEPAKQLIWTQSRVWMGYLHTAGSHPARKLGLCAAREGPERHQEVHPARARRGTEG